ncbi:alpha-glucan family phosphorylase, partial [candidate division WOR-3 bacterium]|nr:alpha-glucan family phosphorylase [candidate division WOR-3 bacterium]
FAGKAYPTDYDGKSMIRKIYKGIHELKDDIQIVYIENYDMEVAQLMVAGVDVWLNTPRPRLEASGTSGMKAAHNGVPSLSVLDGWWVEGCIEGVTGWSIEDGDDRRCANSLYDKLENVVIPTFYGNRAKWLQVMKNTIIRNASQFNTYRLITEYMMVFDRLRGQTST